MVSARQKKGIMLGAAGLLATTIALFAATASAAPSNGNGNGNGKDDGYTGPDPNRPPGKRPTGNGKKPTEPSYRPPTDLAPADLWISPECDATMVGPNWMQQTATPAIAAWVADGFGMPLEISAGANYEEQVRTGLDRVIREVLGPYSPLCIDTWPWWDVYVLENPPPDPWEYGALEIDEEGITWESEGAMESFDAVWGDWNQGFRSRLDAAIARYPGLHDLVKIVGKKVHEEWSSRSGGANA